MPPNSHATVALLRLIFGLVFARGVGPPRADPGQNGPPSWPRNPNATALLLHQLVGLIFESKVAPRRKGPAARAGPAQNGPPSWPPTPMRKSRCCVKFSGSFSRSRSARGGGGRPAPRRPGANWASQLAPNSHAAAALLRPLFGLDFVSGIGPPRADTGPNGPPDGPLTWLLRAFCRIYFPVAFERGGLPPSSPRETWATRAGPQAPCRGDTAASQFWAHFRERGRVEAEVARRPALCRGRMGHPVGP